MHWEWQIRCRYWTWYSKASDSRVHRKARASAQKCTLIQSWTHASDTDQVNLLGTRNFYKAAESYVAPQPLSSPAYGNAWMLQFIKKKFAGVICGFLSQMWYVWYQGERTIVRTMHIRVICPCTLLKSYPDYVIWDLIYPCGRNALTYSSGCYRSGSSSSNWSTCRCCTHPVWTSILSTGDGPSILLIRITEWLSEMLWEHLSGGP